MWSSAVYNLRLSDEAFYALTPRKFDALQKRHKYQTESNEILFAQLTSWVANTGFKSCEKPTSITDFMPSKWQRKAETAKVIKRRRRAVIAEEIRRTMAAFGRG